MQSGFKDIHVSTAEMCKAASKIFMFQQQTTKYLHVYAWAVLQHFITAYEETQSNRVCLFRFLNNFNASRGSSFKVYCVFTAAGVEYRVAAVKVTPYRLYVFWSFGVIGLILNRFENGVSLKSVLGVGARQHFIAALKRT